MDPELIYICGLAFFVVILLLAFLSIIIRLILVLFPASDAKSDPALIAAITSSYSVMYPGTKISKMEELK